MSSAPPHPITRVLKAIQSGDSKASAELFSLVYDALRQLSRALMANKAPGQTLEPTALVHEAYLRVAAQGDAGWESRAHFFGAAAQAMRNILVDQARRRSALKRGGGRRRQSLELEDEELAIESPHEDIIALDEALERLEREDRRKGQIVNLRYFAGLTVPETAEVLQVSTATVEREWRYIRVWLFRQIEGERHGPSGHGA